MYVFELMTLIMYRSDARIKRKIIICCFGLLFFFSISWCAIFRYGTILSNNSVLAVSSNVNKIDRSAVNVRMEQNATYRSIFEKTMGNNDRNRFYLEKAGGDNDINNIALVVLIMSAPGNIERRQAIRHTWALAVPEQVKIRFVLGTKFINHKTKTILNEEWETNKDLISLPNLEDNYKKLTIKLIQTLKWIHNKYTFTHLLKVDDDTFVRVREFLKVLQTKPTKGLYWGFILNDSTIHTEGQYAEPKPYICSKYVSYALGGGYALSEDLVTYITDNSDRLKVFANEDISVGTWLAPLDINMIHDDRFRVMGDCKENQFIFHHSTIKDMIDFNERLALSNKFCPEASRWSILGFLFK